jgi:hypothetical protein
VSDATQIRRVELLLALLGVTAAIAALIVTLDAVRFHAASPFHVEAEGILVLAFAAVSTAALGLALRSGMRDLLAQRSRVRSLRRLGTTIVDGREIVVVAGAAPIAFCSGLLRPRIFVSQGALQRLSAAELLAVVAHEGHHADRRDPLRLLIGRALAASLRPIPAVGALGRRQAVLAELAADAAAVRSLGSPAPLAGALLAFDEHGSAAGVTPERVDNLLGELAHELVPRALLVLTGVCLGGLAGFAFVLLRAPEHPELPVGAAPLCLATVYVIAGPAWLASRRFRRRLPAAPGAP